MEKLSAIIVLLLSIGCSTERARPPAATPRPSSTIAMAADTANPVGVWRGTSVCTQRPSACNDEIDVYRINRVNASDSLSVDAGKIVNGQEEEMGVLACRIVSGTQFRCTIRNGVWYFTVRRDSLVGELRLPDNSKFRDVRAARSR